MATPQALDRVLNGTKEERIFLCEQDMMLFAIYYFSEYFTYKPAPFHHDLSKDMRDLVDGKIRECAWIAFRESAKTTFAQIAIIWMICYKKREYINTDSFDRENSERILFDVTFELVNNERLVADFGRLFKKTKNMDEVKQTRVNNFITENGIRVEAHTTQESMRGRKHLNKRPDALIVDDFENNKTRDSEAYTRQVARHLSEAMAGMAPNGFILYLGNYITEYGNVQALMDRSKTDKKLRVRNIPVMKDNVPTWPAKYCLTDAEAEETGKVSIQDKQRQLGSQVFSYEMMNQPIDDALAEFKKEWIQRVEEEELRHMTFLTFITIDSAPSKKDKADYTGITINRVSSENKWYIKSYRLKVNSKELIDHIFFLWDTYNPEILGLEETTFTLAVKPFLEIEMRKRNKFFTITPLKHGGTKKETRIRGLIPYYETGTVFHVGDNSELEDEMRVFPHGLNDDVLDSLGYQPQIAFKPDKTEDIPDDIEEEPLYSEIGI